MKKLLTLGIAVVAVAGLVGLSTVSVSAFQGGANGNGAKSGYGQDAGRGMGRQGALESKAKVMGMTADELEKALETKTLSQIAVDKGMSETDFRGKMESAAKARWQARGLSNEEIAKRVADRKDRQAENQANCDGFGSGNGKRQDGYGRNR